MCELMTQSELLPSMGEADVYLMRNCVHRAASFATMIVHLTNVTLLLSESFAQKLEIKDSEEPISPISFPLHLSSPPLHHKAHTATPASTVAASEIEIEVLQSNVTPPSEARSPTKRSRGRPRKVADIQELAQMEAVEEGRVVNDHQFSIPVPESDVQQSEVVQINTTQTSGPQESMPIILQAVEEAQVAASIAERQTETTSESGTMDKVQVANTPQHDSHTSMNDLLPKNQESDGEVPQDLYSSKAVRLDHPYSESPWKKRSPGDAEGTGSGEQHEQEGGEQQEGTSSPQKARRSNRRTQGSSTSNKRAAAAKQSSPAGEPSTSTDASTSRRTRSKGGKKVTEMDTEDPTMSPPPAKRTRRAVAHKPQKHAEEEKIERHPLEWGVEEVAEFVSGIPHCDYADVFKEHVRTVSLFSWISSGWGEAMLPVSISWDVIRFHRLPVLEFLHFFAFMQEVDGESLLSLDPEMMVKLMGLKTGPALRIHRKILALKRQFTIPSLENK